MSEDIGYKRSFSDFPTVGEIARDARKAGRREVVEWIEQYSHASMRDIFGDDWRAKLKEWGIE